MRTLLSPLCCCLALLLASTVPLQAQDLHPSRRPSPVGIAKAHLGDAYVKVVYSRPYMRDRAIFGVDTDDMEFLVPYGEVWRTGANEATEITLTEALLVDGQRLEAGTYSIFTVPGPDTWSVHFSPQLGLDGTGRLDPMTEEFTADVYDPSQDVLVVQAATSMLDEEVDQFTIAFEPAGAPTALVLSWEKTAVRLPLQPTSSSSP